MNIQEKLVIGEPRETKDNLLGIEWTIEITAPERESNRLVGNLYGRTEEEVLSMAEDFVESSKPKDNWISVKDRLPEMIGSYIIFYYDERDVSTPRCMAWSFHNSNNEWCVENEKIYSVTHWQPLPEAPQTK